MKYLVVLPIILFLAACGNWLGVPEDIDVSGEVSITKPSVMVKNGRFYVKEHAGEITVGCMVYDEYILLPEGEWLYLDIANTFRTIPPTEAELINCL